MINTEAQDKTHPVLRVGEVLVLLLALFFFCWRLNDVRLFDLDEGLYVTAARNMAQSGDYVTPRLNSMSFDDPTVKFVPFFEKPILIYWMSAVCIRLFGEYEGAARLPSAITSLIGGFVVYWAGRRWFNRTTGLIAAFLYTSAPMIMIDARQTTTDSALTLWILLSLIAIREKQPILFWISSALAILTKGIAGILLPVLVFIVYNVLLRIRVEGTLRTGLKVVRHSLDASTKPASRWLVENIIGILLCILIAAPWHIAIANTTEVDPEGRNWVQEYLIRQHIGRFQGGDTVHNAPLPTYVAYFLVGFFPWACFTPQVLLRRNKVNHPSGTSPDATTLSILFLKCWFWTIFLFFTLSAAKLPTYIVPAYPAAAILLADWLTRLFNKSPKSYTSPTIRHGSLAVLIVCGLLTLTMLVVPMLTRNKPLVDVETERVGTLLFFGMMVCALLAWLALRRIHLTRIWLIRGFAAYLMLSIFCVLVLAGPGYSLANRRIFGAYQDTILAARKNRYPGQVVVIYGVVPRRPSMLFYARDFSPIELQEAPLFPLVQKFLTPQTTSVDIVTHKAWYDKELSKELMARGLPYDILERRDSGLTTWLLVRVYLR